MNILFVCDEYPPGKTGGIGIITALMAKTLAAKGHRVFVVGLCAPGYGGKDYEVQDQVSIWRFRYGIDVGLISSKDGLTDKIFLHGLRNLGVLQIDAKKQFAKMLGFIHTLLLKESIDVIEMPDWNNFFFNLALKDLKIPLFKVPLVVKMHGSFSSIHLAGGLNINQDVFQKEKYLYERADALCAVSNYIASTCKHMHALEKPITTLYNGVEQQPYPDSDKRANSNRVLFSGSLLANKGIFSLIKAWPLVLKKVPNASLHVFGKGNITALQNLLDKKQLTTVNFYGHVSRNELLEELKTTDVACFPSYTEAFGLGPVEAMGLGCAVIFTKRSTGKEIIDDGKDGVLVDPDDLEDISEGIIKLLSDKKLREAMGRKAYEKVTDKFNIQRICDEHVLYYQKVITHFNAVKGGR